jgi:hypothetical protein
MDDARGNWAILVAQKHGVQDAGYPTDAARIDESRQLLARASSVAVSGRTCAVIAAQFEQDWHLLAEELAPLNCFVQPSEQPILEGVARCLNTVREREPDANVILIPADHCAAVESAWVSSANNALLLGRQSDTVYILHDKPQNDPRTSLQYPGICSSSVIVGSVRSLLDLCAGQRATKVVDILVEDRPAAQVASNDVQALNVVHITSVEEYAKLQRGEYGRQPSKVNVHA